MIAGLPSRGVDTRVAPRGRARRKVLIVTRSLPGHDAGFAKSGHAQYLQAVIDHFIDSNFETVVVVFDPRVDFLALPQARLRYRVVSPALSTIAGCLTVTGGAALRSAVTWLVYARLPRAFQTLGSRLRTAVRKSQGFVHVLGTFIDGEETNYVRRLVMAERPDIVLFDGLFNVCGRLSDAEHWVLTHEVKYQRAASFSEQGVSVLPAGFSREAERALLSEIGNVIAIQWDDRDEFERLLPEARIVVVPVPMDVPTALPEREAVPGRCLFVGSGSFHNVDGITWFLRSCWPAIIAAAPHATLDIYGTVCYRLDDLPPGVTAHGAADDLSEAYARAAVAIVPLQIGSGLKVKLVEALAYGVPVVTTPVGAQGLSGFQPRPFLTAHTADEFAADCLRILTSPDLARDLAESASICAQRFTRNEAFAEFVAATAVNPSQAEPSTTRVCLVIPTYRRTELLARLLRGIFDQAFDRDTCAVDIVVLDNDPAGSAETTVEQLRAESPFPLLYDHVREAGLSAVRNRGLEHAGGYDFMAMIDDDEIPAPNWLAQLLRVAHARAADVVVGPVSPIVAPGTPAWIGALRAKETPVFADEASLRDGWSCNALVSMPTVRALGVQFDPALNFAGGEDQLFFRQLLAGGATIAYAAHASVSETIPPDRQTARFNLLRAFRRGNSLSFCDRRMYPGFATAVIRGAKAVRVVVLGLLKLCRGLIDRDDALILHACDVASGLGMLAGLTGSMYQAYRRHS